MSDSTERGRALRERAQRAVNARQVLLDAWVIVTDELARVAEEEGW